MEADDVYKGYSLEKGTRILPLDWYDSEMVKVVLGWFLMLTLAGLSFVTPSNILTPTTIVLKDGWSQIGPPTKNR